MQEKNQYKTLLRLLGLLDLLATKGEATTKEIVLLGFLLDSGSGLGSLPDFRETVRALRHKLAEVFKTESLREDEHEFARLFGMAPVFEHLSRGAAGSRVRAAGGDLMTLTVRLERLLCLFQDKCARAFPRRYPH